MNRRHRFCVGTVVWLAIVAGSPALAHHSVPGTFNVDKVITIKGTVSKIDWINPHIYIYLDVKDKDGSVTTWKVETLPTNHMRRAGITKADILVSGTGGKSNAFLLRITYPEGHFVHIYGDEDEIPAAN
jgi:hypothetical protein